MASLIGTISLALYTPKESIRKVYSQREGHVKSAHHDLIRRARTARGPSVLDLRVGQGDEAQRRKGVAPRREQAVRRAQEARGARLRQGARGDGRAAPADGLLDHSGR